MRTNLTKKEISNKIYTEIGFSKKFSDNLIDDILKLLQNNLVKKNNLKLSNFGTFSIKHKKERIGRNPKTKNEFKISSRNVLTFKPSKNFKTFINES